MNLLNLLLELIAAANGLVFILNNVVTFEQQETTVIKQIQFTKGFGH